LLWWDSNRSEVAPSKFLTHSAFNHLMPSDCTAFNYCSWYYAIKYSSASCVTDLPLSSSFLMVSP